MLISPLTPGKDAGTLPPEMVFSVGYLWGLKGKVRKLGGHIEADNSRGKVAVYLVGRDSRYVDVPVAEPYFSPELSESVGLSTGNAEHNRDLQGDRSGPQGI